MVSRVNPIQHIARGQLGLGENQCSPGLMGRARPFLTVCLSEYGTCSLRLSLEVYEFSSFAVGAESICNRLFSIARSQSQQTETIHWHNGCYWYYLHQLMGGILAFRE